MIHPSQRLVKKLRACAWPLSQQQSRVMDFLRMWDADGSGEIEKKEFVAALHGLGLSAPKDELFLLFDTFDADGGGSISYKELHRQLRAGADADLSHITVKDKFGNIIDVNLAAGAAGKFETREELIARGMEKGHEARRKKGSAMHGSERLVASEQDGSVQQQLRAILKENAVRIIDLFRDWDEDQSGTITFKEFRRAIGSLGYDAPVDDLRAVRLLRH